MEKNILHATVIRMNDGKEKTMEEQMQAIKGMSIDAFVRELKRNEGGKYDKIFVKESA